MRSRPSSWFPNARLIALIVALLAFASPSRSRAQTTAEKVVDLYTIGQGSYLYASYGHSVLCVRDAGTKPGEGKGQCYDYGVADKPDVLYSLWASLRGRPIFTPVTIDDRGLVAFFEDQSRAVERQVLPLAKEEANALATRLASDVATRWSYAYHPLFENCATQLRDRIDAATKGRLRAGPNDPGKLTFRQRMDAGLSGRMFELMGLALIMGPSADRVPDGWEAMYLPDGLRDGVADRLGVKPEQVAERQAVILPTSAGAGRLAMFILAFVLFLLVRLGARTKRLGLAVGLVGALLGTLALAVDLVALASTWTMFSRNVSLLVLFPTDLALGWMRGPKLRVYVTVRLAVVLAVAVLEIASVVSQPMLACVALVALPFAGLLGAIRAETDVVPTKTTATAPARAA